jgi:glutaredoxin-like YruB-family protein
MPSDNLEEELARIREKKLSQLRSSLAENIKEKKPKVQVYSTPTCPYCHMAKQYLKAKGIEFEDIDVSKDINAARYMVSQTGEMGVPQININGHWIIGFNRPQIDYYLQNL